MEYRRLDKAAVIDERTPPVSPKEQKEQELLGHLCTAEQVREVKHPLLGYLSGQAFSAVVWLQLPETISFLNKQATWIFPLPIMSRFL